MPSINAPRDAVQAPPACYDAVVLDRDNRRLGFVHHHASAVEAFDLVERSIGMFEDERSAVTAVWHHACRYAVQS
jgi:hypothetical protein